MKDWITDFKNSFKEISTPDAIPAHYRKLVFWCIVVLILAIRFLTIQTPALDRTVWKEIDYISISKNYLANGFNFFQPTISWPAEPPNVTAMELPVIPYLAALLYKIFGFNVWTVRLLPIIFYLLIIYYVYKLTYEYFGPVIGLIAAFISGILPLNNSFGNVLFSDPAMVAFSIFTIFYFSQWMKYGRKKDRILATLGFSLAVALKIEPLYLLLPLSWLFFKKYRLDIKKYKVFISFILISLILPVCWYLYAYFLTNHSIDVFGIFKGHNKLQTFTMLSNSIWYFKMKWNLSSLLGHWVGLILIFSGITSALLLRKGSLFFFYLAAVFIYFILVAEGNIDTSYRQFCIIPPAAAFMALGSTSISLLFIKIFKRYINAIYFSPFVILWIALIIPLLIPIHKSHYIFLKDINQPVEQDQWDYAQIIKKYAGPKSKIITTGTYTMHVGGNDLSPVLYYYSGLKGWTLEKKNRNLNNVNILINKGADLFAAIYIQREPDMIGLINRLKKDHVVLFEDQKGGFILLSLKNKSISKNGKD